MSKIYLLLWPLSFFSNCSTNNHSFVQLKVVPQFEVYNKMKLSFFILSNRDSTFLWDWNALSVETSNVEKDNLISSKDGPEDILKKISNSQIVIENKKMSKRFFSDVKLFEGETVNVKTFFRAGDSYDTIRARAGKEFFIQSRSIDVNRFKIIESDTTIRLHYLFKPTKEQESVGFKPLIITSEWFSLKNS